MKFKSMLLAAWFSVVAVNVNAGGDSNKTINTLGIQDGMAYFFSLKEGLSTNCLYGVVYAPSNNDFGKGAFSLLLLAKSSERKISIEYNQDSSGICFLKRVDLL